jgi:hypothetical protein
LNLTVDRGPNWLFVKLRPRRNKTNELPQLGDELWSIASRHFIYRLVLELEELKSLPAGLMEQLVLLHDRLVESGGALRVCGLSTKCAQALRDAALTPPCRTIQPATPRFTATRRSCCMKSSSRRSLPRPAKTSDRRIARDADPIAGELRLAGCAGRRIHRTAPHLH